jgi:hypothetical protein
MFKKILAALMLAGVAFTISTGTANAVPVNPNPTHTARTWTPPKTWHHKRTWHPRTVTVTPGMTLWRVSVICRGYQFDYSEKAGHLWPTIARRNHIKGTTIRVGQRLTC